MATAQLSTLLRHIHRLAGEPPGSTRRLTDCQLLDDFAARRDEAAFAALVGRHGPMVLRVCRRVLNHEQDAEDAFQATFLVLARHIHSIRKREALANWLYGVAYRTAMKAKRSAARRRQHEAKLWAQKMGTAPLSSKGQSPFSARSPSWDEVQAVLDEEIQRLPDRHRAAFVLCVLEGKSRPQAAAELGVREGTVWSRLTRARQQLQRRLTRRGINLAAVLAALSVAEAAGKAALPAVLASATVRCGLLVAAGGTAAGQIPSHIAALAAGVTRAMLLTKAKIAIGVMLAMGLFAAAGALAYQPLGAREAPPPTQKTEPAAKVDAKSPSVGAKRQAADEPAGTLEFSGRVLGPDGKPVAGAKVYYHFITREDEPIPVRSRTDAQGQFSFTLGQKDVPLSADATQSDPLKTGHIVVKADGFTFAWRGVAKGTADLDFRLARDDTPIQGRILDLQGRPLAGLKVTVLSMAAPDKGDLTPFLQALKPRASLYVAIWKHLPNLFYNPLIYRPHYLPILPSAKTDADGRFRLPGFAAEQLIELRIEGSTIETQNLFVLTRAKPANAAALLSPPRYQIQESEYSGPAEQAFLRWNSFEHAVAPGQVVVGTVRDEVTKAPIPGAIVESYMLAGTNLAQNSIYHTVADEQGRYRFSGLPRGKGNSIRIRPTKDQPYLPVVKTVPAKEVFEEAMVDVDLPPGVFVRVTAKDKWTGQPVPGYVSYFLMPEKLDPAAPWLRPFADSYNDFMPIPNDGKFRFVALRRKAIVAFRADWEKYPIAREAPTIRLPASLSSSNYQAFTTIHPKTDDKVVKVDFVLDAGGVVKGRVVAPDGKPVAGVLAAGLRHDWYIDSDWPPVNKTGEFIAKGLDPNHPRLVCFSHWEKKLAGSVVLRGDEKEPVTVELQPWGTVSGRLIDVDGKPIKNATLWFTEVPRGKAGQPRALDVGLHVIARVAGKPRHDPHTDEEGRFKVEALVPGLKYNLALVDERGAIKLEQIKWEGLVFANLFLKPGETKELGDVKLQPFPKE